MNIPTEDDPAQTFRPEQEVRFNDPNSHLHYPQYMPYMQDRSGTGSRANLSGMIDGNTSLRRASTMPSLAPRTLPPGHNIGPSATGCDPFSHNHIPPSVQPVFFNGDRLAMPGSAFPGMGNSGFAPWYGSSVPPANNVIHGDPLLGSSGTIAPHDTPSSSQVDSQYGQIGASLASSQQQVAPILTTQSIRSGSSSGRNAAAKPHTTSDAQVSDPGSSAPSQPSRSLEDRALIKYLLNEVVQTTPVDELIKDCFNPASSMYRIEGDRVHQANPYLVTCSVKGDQSQYGWPGPSDVSIEWVLSSEKVDDLCTHLENGHGFVRVPKTADTATHTGGLTCTSLIDSQDSFILTSQGKNDRVLLNQAAEWYQKHRVFDEWGLRSSVFLDKVDRLQV